MMTKSCCLILMIAGLVVPSMVSARDADIMAVARPWVAESLTLTPEQSEKTISIVADFQKELRAALSSYPTGGQDADGTRIRERIVMKIEMRRDTAIHELQQLLSDEHRTNVAELTANDRPSREIVLQEGRFTALLQPPGLDGLKLTKSQSARLRAWILQAEEDWLEEHLEPEQRLKVMRQQIDDRLLELLTEEQRNKWLPNRDRERAAPQRRMIRSGGTGAYLFESLRSEYAPMNQRVAKPGKILPVSGLGSLVHWREQPESGERDRPLWHPEDELVSSLATSPDGRWIITIGTSVKGIKQATEIRLWEASTGKLMDVALSQWAPVSSASIRFYTSESVQIVTEPFGR